MGTLEKVMQMRQQGSTDPQIIDSLKQEGISPKEINDALSQSQVKSALTNEQNIQGNMTSVTSDMSQQNMQNMIPSMTESSQATMPSSKPETSSENMSINMMAPQSAPGTIQPTYPMQNTMPMLQETIQPTYPMQETQQYQYPEYQYTEYQNQGDIGTINEIAEQIVEEKTSSLKKQISSFKKFQEEIALDVEKLNERLTKIENTLNDIQSAILGKVGILYTHSSISIPSSSLSTSTSNCFIWIVILS